MRFCAKHQPILRKDTRPPTEVIAIFADQHKEQYGIKPIFCRQIQIAPSSYYKYKARERDPDRLPDRTKRDKALERYSQQIRERNFKVYGSNKVWWQLICEGIRVARCTVERLMQKLEIQGIRRGKTCGTTIVDDLLDRPAERLTGNLQRRHPNQLWIAGQPVIAYRLGVE